MEGLVRRFDCREVSRRVAEGALEDGSALGRLRIFAHFLVCSHCRRFVRELRLLAKAARQWSDRLLEPRRQAEREDRLIARLRR